MAYLLDTNILSDIARNPFGAAADRVLGLRGERLHTSAIVIAELRFGIIRSGSARLAQLIDPLLAITRIVPFDEAAADRYGELRAELERSGRLIGPNDLLIAAQCLAGDFTLVTDNMREFERVPGLRLENWLR